MLLRNISQSLQCWKVLQWSETQNDRILLIGRPYNILGKCFLTKFVWLININLCDAYKWYFEWRRVSVTQFNIIEQKISSKLHIIVLSRGMRNTNGEMDAKQLAIIKTFQMSGILLQLILLMNRNDNINKTFRFIISILRNVKMMLVIWCWQSCRKEFACFSFSLQRNTQYYYYLDNKAFFHA